MKLGEEKPSEQEIAQLLREELERGARSKAQSYVMRAYDALYEVLGEGSVGYDVTSLPGYTAEELAHLRQARALLARVVRERSKRP